MYPIYGYNPLIFMPYIPHDCDKPPTVYAILNSIVNYGLDNKEKIKNLAKLGRAKIFDFDYNLTSNISKEDFEVMILNHYLMRRIGYETVTAFKIALNVRLNEILPKYNMLFDSIQNWNLFSDGQVIEKNGSNNTNKNVKTQATGTDSSESSSNSSTESTIESENELVDKRKHSDLPQSQLQNIDNASYVNQYDVDNNNSSTTSTNNGTAENSSTSTNISTNNSNTDDETLNNYNETIKYSQSDLINLYTRFQNEVQNVYTMIFRDLDVLFYGLI